MPQQSILSALINLSVQGKACVIVPIAIQQYPCIYLCILWTCKWIPYTLMNESIDNWHKCVASLGVHHIWSSKNWKCYAVWLCPKKGELYLHIICCVLKRYFREKKFENNRNKIILFIWQSKSNSIWFYRRQFILSHPVSKKSRALSNILNVLDRLLRRKVSETYFC